MAKATKATEGVTILEQSPLEAALAATEWPPKTADELAKEKGYTVFRQPGIRVRVNKDHLAEGRGAPFIVQLGADAEELQFNELEMPEGSRMSCYSARVQRGCLTVNGKAVCVTTHVVYVKE